MDVKIGEKVNIYSDQEDYLLSGESERILNTDYTDYKYGIKIEGDPELLFVKLENIKMDIEIKK